MPTGTQDGRKRLYLDFDGYFAAVEEQAAPALHGRPVAVLPYPEARTCVISANAAAKRHGVGTGTGVDEARRRCPGIALVSQRPDLYVRVQRRIASAVNAEIPIDAVCSVDELCCVLGARDGAEDVLDGGGVEPLACEGGLGDGQAGRAHGARCAAGPAAGPRP